jgi:putative acetyltransferase
MSRAYARARAVYFIAEEDGRSVGGAGSAPLAGAATASAKHCCGAVCVPRSFGYQICYLPTRSRMAAAQHLYERAGFRPLSERLGASGNCGCDRWFALEL